MLTRDAIFGEGENFVTRSFGRKFALCVPTLIGRLCANIYGGNTRSATWISSMSSSLPNTFLTCHFAFRMFLNIIIKTN